MFYFTSCVSCLAEGDRVVGVSAVHSSSTEPDMWESEDTPVNFHFISLQLFCQSLTEGGHLASIHWEEHNNFIKKVIAAKDSRIPHTWIGFSDIHKVGKLSYIMLPLNIYSYSLF